MRLASLCCGVAFALCIGSARADTPVAVYKTFTGNVNFVGAENTLRTNATNCNLNDANKDLVLQVRKIPGGSTILSAQLYWAGSNTQSAADYTVNFGGIDVTAPSSRRYFSDVGSGQGYFAGAVDVTAQITAGGNGDYHVKGLTANKNVPWCKGQGVLGGYALLVVYSNPAEAFRVLNLYEGFQYLLNSSVTFSSSNFKVPRMLDDGHVAYLAWSGDKAISGGERVIFNGFDLFDTKNPLGNPFNSVSTMPDTVDVSSFGIDFDDYLLALCSCLAGRTNATLTLQTAQDVILVQGAMMAIPSEPTADLQITLARDSELSTGTNTSYLVRVNNAGPNTEIGPVTVTDTLPSGLKYIGFSGTGWSCAAAGQAVTCTSAGALAAGASLPLLTITVQVTGGGSFTNTVTVSGKSYDYAPANNTASDTASTAGPYVFTDGPCVAGKAFGAADQPCRRFKGPVTAGDTAAIYVTAVDGNQAPRVVNSTASANVAVRFALSCINPAAAHGVSATLAGTSLACVPNGVVPGSSDSGWSGTISLTFAANSASTQPSAGFRYEDVGQVVLSMIDGANMVNSSAFVVKPASIAFAAIKRTSDGVPNPSATNGSGIGFARAGEAFTIAVAALTSTGKQAPGFGSEGAQVALLQQQQGNLPALQGGFDTLANGVISGTGFKWDEVGIIVLTPQLAGNDYLGAGPVAAQPVNVGRFFPDHFETAVSPAFGCLPRMACPSGVTAAGDPLDVAGAVYSGQQFTVTVRPMGASGNVLTNYSGEFARPITLAPYSSPAGMSFNPGGGKFRAGTNTIGSVASGEEPLGHPIYDLPATYASTAPRANNWTQPTPIYVRASSLEVVAMPAGGTLGIVVSSKRASATVEGALVVVAGRLNLANAHGSELLRLPVPGSAQYWSGKGWENNSADNISSIPASATFTACLKNLSTGGAGPANCKGALALLPGPALALQDGRATLWLQAPGAGNDGSGSMQMAMTGTPWLPSTAARVSFGLYKSPVLLLREVY